jgi:ribonuclease R
MKRALPSRTAVLDLIGAEDRALHAQEVADRLGVGPESYQGLLRLLDDLVFDGVLTARGQRFKLDKKRGGAATKNRERREGLLTVNPRGFGFVASPTATGDDVFVNAESLGNAMHGDQVVVEIVARGSRGAEGQIVDVKKRGTPRVSGILRRRGKSAYVELDDPRIRGPVVLTREIDRAGPEGNSGADGQVVVVEITRYPEEPAENPEGKLVAVLGAPGELSVEVNKVLFLEQVDALHSQEATEEAEGYGLEVPRHMLEGREDLTHIPLPTIDPEDARDHDDAVWVERTERGGYEVWVAIADVSSYVQPGMRLDDEARARGCSIYLPDRAIPMLPRALSSNLCSLLPDVTRLCLCVHAELDARGDVKTSRLVRGFMKSRAKLTYGGVARALGFSALPPRDEKAEEMVDGLRVAYECARVLRSRRLKRGSLDFDLPEPVVKLDEQGKPISVTRRANDPGVKKAYQLIEDLMIFANEVVARWLIEHQLPGIFRVHLPPDPQKLERLAAMCEVLGIELDVEETQTPKGLADILKRFADHPNATVLNSLLLRSMKQAAYDVANQGHFGLASEAYLHFTSPIRRYPDLVVHRVVHAALSSERDRKKALARAASPEALAEAALQSSLAERRAMEVEREILDVYRCFYMIDRIGERFEGTVSAFVGSGAFVTLVEPFVDVLVRVEDLGADWVIEDDGLMATSKRSGDAIRLGDRIVVDVTDVAILRRTVYGRRARGAEASTDDRPRSSRGGRKQTHQRDRGGPERGARGRSGAERGPARSGSAGGRGERGGSEARGGAERSGGTERGARDARGSSLFSNDRRGKKKGKGNKGGPGPARARKGKPGKRRR